MIQLSLVEEKQPTVYLSSQYEQHEISYISFGSIALPCIVKTLPHLQNEIMISTALFQQLEIPFCESVHLFINEETVHLGPLIGIFSAGFTGSPLRPIGQRSLFFAKLLSTVKSTGGYAFLFGAHHIDWDNGTVKGYFYTEDGWLQKEVPFPHVVYDRLPNRRTENHEMFVAIKEKLQSQYLIPWFNPGFFNKWDIYQLLYSNLETRQLLPETHRNPSADLIAEMLTKYKGIFLKPVNGSLGKGIFEISCSDALEKASYYCRYRDGEKNVFLKFYELPALLSYLFKEKTLEEYVVQRRINLMRSQERRLDFRVHTNKNEQGEWQLTAMAAKVAGKGSITTHINNGGFIKTLEEIFLSPDKCNRIKHQLESTALLISKLMEKEMKGFIGEVGFDFGIDRKGRLWLFEANSKPGRSIFKHPKLYEQDVLTRRLSLSYATHLTEKSILQPEELYL